MLVLNDIYIYLCVESNLTYIASNLIDNEEIMIIIAKGVGNNYVASIGIVISLLRKIFGSNVYTYSILYSILKII